MAKVFLDANDQFNISNNSTSVFGTSGEEVVLIANGVTGMTLDQNVERTQFTGSSSDYKYLQAGNQLKVYATDGTTLLATIPLQGDDNGSQLTFTNGTVDVKLAAGGVMSFGGATVSGTTVGSLTPTTIAATPASPDNTPRFSVAAGADTAAEGGAGASFVVTLSAAQATATTVNFALSGTGGATVGTDTGTAVVSGTGVTSSGSTITFAPGSTVATVTVPVIFDTVTETGEGLKLDLSSPSTGTGLSLTKPTSASVTLTDPAAPNFTLTSNAGGTPTQEGSAITFTVTPSSVVVTDTNLTVNLAGATVGAITTQASASDFSPNSTSVTFKAGDTAAKTVTVNVVSDGTSEGIEGYKASLLDSGFSEKASVTGTINDPVANLVLSGSSTVNEGSAATYTVTSSIAAPTGGITVPYTIAGGATLPASSADYTGSAATGTLTIAAGSTSATLALTATADNATEGDESLVVTLGNPSSGTVSTSSVTTTIKDTSVGLAAGKVVLSQAGTSVNEGSSNTYTVTVGTAAPTGGLLIPYTLSGTATNTTDYTGSTGTITIAAGATTGSVSLAATADTATEGSETIIVTLGTLPSGYTLNSTAEGTVTTTINDTSTAPVANTFTLTTGIDNVTSSYNAVTAIIDQTTAANTTWNLSDTVAPAAGSTINLSLLNHASGATAGYNSSNVTTLNIKSVDQASTGAANSFDVAGITGLTKLSIANSSVVGTTADTLTVSSLASTTSLDLTNNGQYLNVTATGANWTGSNDTLNLSVAGRSGALLLGTGIETVAITTSGSDARLASLTSQTTATNKTVTVAGTGLKIDAVMDSTITSFDASSSTGAVNVYLAPGSVLTSAKGGSGSADVLAVNSLPTTLTTISGFETLMVEASGTYDLSNATSVTTLGVDATNGGSIAPAFTNAAAGTTTISVNGGAQRTTAAAATGDLATGAISYALKTATGTTDSLTLSLSNGGTATTGTLTLGGLTTTNVENVTINTADWKAITLGGLNLGASVSTNAAVAVTGSGAANVTFGTVTIPNTGQSSTVSTVNLSAMTGTNSLTISGTESLTLTGGSGNDTVTNGAAGASETQTYNLGAGNDAFTFVDVNASGTLVVNGDAGDDSFTAAAFTTSTQTGNKLDGGAGTDTLIFTGGVSLLSLSTIDNVEKIQAQVTGAIVNGAALSGDTIEVTNFAATTGRLTLQSGNSGSTVDASKVTFTGPNTGLIIKGGSGVDNITGTSSTDDITGGAGADSITLTETTNAVDTIRYAESATTDVDNVTGFAVGAGKDVLLFSVATTFVNGTASVSLSDSAGADISAAAGTNMSFVTLAAGGTSATVSDAEMLKLSTGGTSFAAAIGTGSLQFANATDFGTNEGLLTSWYDTTNSKAVFGILIDSTDSSTFTSADTFVEITRVGMTSTDYSNFVTGNVDFF